MNVNQDVLEKSVYRQTLSTTEMSMKRTFGSVESLYVTDTYQFDDYSKYESSSFSEEAKAKRLKEVFPEDCQKAFEMGARFAR